MVLLRTGNFVIFSREFVLLNNLGADFYTPRSGHRPENQLTLAPDLMFI